MSCYTVHLLNMSFVGHLYDVYVHNVMYICLYLVKNDIYTIYRCSEMCVNLGFEAHVKHAVSLIQHHVRAPAQVCHAT